MENFTYSQLVSGAGKSPMVVSVNVDQNKEAKYFRVRALWLPDGSG
jgi:hypothetical protein